MTNAEKFKEVFGFEPAKDVCPDESCSIAKDYVKTHSPHSYSCDDCIGWWWDSEYQGEPTIPLSVIEDIKAEIEELGIWHEKLLIETIDIKRVLEIIDKAVKECET